MLYKQVLFLHMNPRENGLLETHGIGIVIDSSRNSTIESSIDSRFSGRSVEVWLLKGLNRRRKMMARALAQVLCETKTDNEIHGDGIGLSASEEMIHEWHNQGLHAAKNYRRAEYEMVRLLKLLSESRGYLLYRAESLRQYAVCLWHLPENAAADLVTVAKKSIEVPALLDVLHEQKTTVSKLRKICPVLTRDNYREWIELATQSPARTIEKAVAMAKPETERRERVTYKTGDRLELVTSVSEELWLKLKCVQDLLSQKLERSASIEEALAAMTDNYLQKHDPVLRADRALARMRKREAKERELPSKSRTDSVSGSEDSNKSASAPSSTFVDSTSSETSIGALVDGRAEQNKNVTCRNTDSNATACAQSELTESTLIHSDCSDSARTDTARLDSVTACKPYDRGKKRIPIPAHIKNAVIARDGWQCTAIGVDGKRCTNRRWLHLHHILEVSRGGTNDIENITSLCEGHHRALHLTGQTITLFREESTFSP
jgi:hypothetical protein